MFRNKIIIIIEISAKIAIDFFCLVFTFDGCIISVCSQSWNRVIGHLVTHLVISGSVRFRVSLAEIQTRYRDPILGKMLMLIYRICIHAQ